MKTINLIIVATFFAASIAISSSADAQTGDELVDLLQEKGADVNARAADGNTPLSLATMKDDQEMESLLKKLGAK